jgi:ferredoxin
VVTPVATTVAATAPATAEPAATAPTASANGDTEGQGAGRYKVKVIANKCIGAASCVAVAPKAFKLNDQQIAEVLATVNQETDENLLLSAQSCPTLAIEVIDTQTGEKVWPK